MGAFREISWPLGDASGSRGEKLFTRKMFPENLISEKYFSGFFYRKTFFCSCCGPMGAFRDISWPLGDASGSRGEKHFTRKMFPENLISEKYFPDFFLAKRFSARVVARWGHLGIFGGPWGTLGGPEGKIFT